jgi:hypothetical protein
MELIFHISVTDLLQHVGACGATARLPVQLPPGVKMAQESSEAASGMHHLFSSERILVDVGLKIHPRKELTL